MAQRHGVKALPSTSGREINLVELKGRRSYTATHERGSLRRIRGSAGMRSRAPGVARRKCAFRDHHSELRALGAEVFGLSTQNSTYQQEVVSRLHLPFELLSDEDFQFTSALRLPTFEIAGMRLLKRVTLVIRDGSIEKVFYPVFPPDKHAEEVIQWLSAQVSQPPAMDGGAMTVM